MLSRTTAGVVSSHRFVLILGTALLAVGTSRLAVGHENAAANWLLTLGGASLMFCGDLLQDIDRVSIELSRTTQQNPRKTRVDIFATQQRAHVWGLLILGFGASLLGLLL